MFTRKIVQMASIPLLGVPHSWVLILFLGAPRNSLQYMSHLLKLSTLLWHTCHMVGETLWLCNLLVELCKVSQTLFQLPCDNICATYIADNHDTHDQNEHIEVDCHFVHEHVSQGNIILYS